MRRVKLYLITIFILILYILIISRLFYFTVLKYSYNFEKIYALEKKRRNIVDRNGVIIATDIKVKNLYLNRLLIDDPELIADSLSNIIGVDYEYLYDKITKSKGKNILIKRNIFPQEENIIRQLAIASLVFEEDYLRFYPNKNLFSHIIGYVNVDKNGVIGLEEYYNEYLKNYGDTPLKLTMDLRIQEVLRNELLNAHEYYNSNFMTGIVMEVKTGNVLALVSIPDFNPNDVNIESSTFNFATYGNYELGSVLKIFTFSNGIENNIINKNTLFNVSNKINYGSFTINDMRYITKKKELNLVEAFSLSSNLSSVQIAEKLGIKKQIRFLDNVGLLEKINTDINQVSLPMQPRRWSKANLMTISYGYGIAVSPLHIISSANSVLNNGFLITPRFSYKFEEQKRKRVVSENTSKIMKELFLSTVKNGTAKLAYIKGLDIGGKTGTARKISNNGYIEGEHIASFFGAFPINDPEYSIIIVADRPKFKNDNHDGTGGSVASEIAKNVILNILPFLDIKPVN